MDEGVRYEIGDDVKSALMRAYSFVEALPSPTGKSVVESRDGKLFADIRALLMQQAFFFGVKPDRIASADVCTICDRRYFSHRREREAAGRQLSFIGGLPNT